MSNIQTYMKYLIIALAVALWSTAVQATDAATVQAGFYTGCTQSAPESLSFTSVDKICHCVTDYLMEHLTIEQTETGLDTEGAKQTRGYAYEICGSRYSR
jgi:hypothetical protein